MDYFWQHHSWPHFLYSTDKLTSELQAFDVQTSRLLGSLEAIKPEDQQSISIQTMVVEAMKTSEIEGEYLSRDDVVSSIQQNLGFKHSHSPVFDLRARGIGKLMTEVAQNIHQPLSEKVLFHWHELLMEGNTQVTSGAWRTKSDPMRVVSGAIGKEVIHFEAPPSNRVPSEMHQFIQWFNNSAPGGSTPIEHAVIRSALGHLYFETIHPFEDGNGRIGRALSDKIIGQSHETPIPVSLSMAIETNKRTYYEKLKKAQAQHDVTEWILYFIETYLTAIKHGQSLIKFTVQKTQLLDKHSHSLSQRQLKVLNKMLDQGSQGFEGGMSAKKHMSITKSSKATATRDLADLKEKGILIQQGSGRSVRYSLPF